MKREQQQIELENSQGVNKNFETVTSHNLTEISSTDDCNIIAVTYNDFVAFTVKGVWPAQLVLS